MNGAPAIQTNPFYKGYDSNPKQDAEAAMFRSQHVVQQVPVYGANVQYSVPSMYYNRGWYAPDVPTCAGPTYPTPVEAPAIHYVNKSYAGLVQLSAAPNRVTNRPTQLLSAPSITTVY